jgi:hypothetical protein
MLATLLSIALVASNTAAPGRDALGALLPKADHAMPALRYGFTCDYATFATKGDVLGHKRFTGTVDMAATGEIRWHGLGLESSGPDGQYRPDKINGLDNGFSYTRSDVAHQLEPSFFAKLPAMPIEIRNFIWDTHMFEQYVANARQLRLGEPRGSDKEHQDQLGGIGEFTSAFNDTTWMAVTTMNGRKCALLRYRSFYNRMHVQQQGLDINGSSQFGGEIWVGLGDGAIEKATIYEEVVAEVGKLGVFPVFRVGELTRVH